MHNVSVRGCPWLSQMLSNATGCEGLRVCAYAFQLWLELFTLHAASSISFNLHPASGLQQALAFSHAATMSNLSAPLVCTSTPCKKTVFRSFPHQLCSLSFCGLCMKARNPMAPHLLRLSFFGCTGSHLFKKSMCSAVRELQHGACELLRLCTTVLWGHSAPAVLLKRAHFLPIITAVNARASS